MGSEMSNALPEIEAELSKAIRLRVAVALLDQISSKEREELEAQLLHDNRADAIGSILRQHPDLIDLVAAEIKAVVDEWQQKASVNA
jgi:hypothetical protein